MVVLVAIAALGLTACYSPSLRDCSVECRSSSECARGQVCGTAGYCAAPEVADRCADVIGDAGMSPPDAAHVTLHVHVDGPGEIDYLSNACRSDCVYSVVVDAQVTLTATDSSEHEFDKWTLGPCMGHTARTCVFAPATATSVTGKWH